MEHRIEGALWPKPSLEWIEAVRNSANSQEWPRMEDGSQRDAISPWSVALFRSLKRAEPGSATEQSAFDKWLDQTSDREEARREPIRGATGIIGEQTKASSQTNAIRTKAARAQGLAEAKLTDPRLRVNTVSLGCVVFLGTAIWIATSPVSVSV